MSLGPRAEPVAIDTDSESEADDDFTLLCASRQKFPTRGFNPLQDVHCLGVPLMAPAEAEALLDTQKLRDLLATGSADPTSIVELGQTTMKLHDACHHFYRRWQAEGGDDVLAKAQILAIIHHVARGLWIWKDNSIENDGLSFLPRAQTTRVTAELKEAVHRCAHEFYATQQPIHDFDTQLKNLEALVNMQGSTPLNQTDQVLVKTVAELREALHQPGQRKHSESSQRSWTEVVKTATPEAPAELLVLLPRPLPSAPKASESADRPTRPSGSRRAQGSQKRQQRPPPLPRTSVQTPSNPSKPEPTVTKPRRPARVPTPTPTVDLQAQALAREHQLAQAAKERELRERMTALSDTVASLCEEARHLEAAAFTHTESAQAFAAVEQLILALDDCNAEVHAQPRPMNERSQRGRTLHGLTNDLRTASRSAEARLTQVITAALSELLKACQAAEALPTDKPDQARAVFGRLAARWEQQQCEWVSSSLLLRPRGLPALVDGLKLCRAGAAACAAGAEVSNDIQRTLAQAEDLKFAAEQMQAVSGTFKKSPLAPQLSALRKSCVDTRENFLLNAAVLMWQTENKQIDHVWGDFKVALLESRKLALNCHQLYKTNGTSATAVAQTSPTGTAAPNQAAEPHLPLLQTQKGVSILQEELRRTKECFTIPDDAPKESKYLSRAGRLLLKEVELIGRSAEAIMVLFNTPPQAREREAQSLNGLIEEMSQVAKAHNLLLPELLKYEDYESRRKRVAESIEQKTEAGSPIERCRELLLLAALPELGHKVESLHIQRRRLQRVQAFLKAISSAQRLMKNIDVSQLVGRKSSTKLRDLENSRGVLTGIIRGLEDFSREQHVGRTKDGGIPDWVARKEEISDLYSGFSFLGLCIFCDGITALAKEAVELAGVEFDGVRAENNMTACKNLSSQLQPWLAELNLANDKNEQGRDFFLRSITEDFGNAQKCINQWVENNTLSAEDVVLYAGRVSATHLRRKVEIEATYDYYSVRINGLIAGIKELSGEIQQVIDTLTAAQAPGPSAGQQTRVRRKRPTK